MLQEEWNCILEKSDSQCELQEPLCLNKKGNCHLQIIKLDNEADGSLRGQGACVKKN